ncbi:hypothetical protein METBIDRAFT_79823 [Metschnikowia bicuspidata var. bicuspidata NRRL YB-4993]|uniref:Ubiquitin carboxyl-terminal hydrolase n=1 Tax=Metschnikowia bicuspidata var. bicuspidata NRRL YB-4993 TaxID=869754 RepID=A0A1A0H5D4_9ASCO|nr:hypothetical protein METBIDRAFT_79823 [Metschnikowia bicuspidata var. bicuspidata NRRL YB-4993]OBA19294.1 hypothetical protein METBIDRAFT_79823 [Metschnikowia bicuspidata var. bicuspidata NRRL YB-4993]
MSSGWNTIVSDAGVFTELVSRLGVKDVQIEELYSIDSASLKALAPVHAVVFLFKYGKVDRDSTMHDVPLDGVYDEDYQDKGIFFARQTIQNACATQAVLNSLLNKTSELDIGTELSNIHGFVAGFDPDMCGDTISNSEVIREVHNSFSAPKFIELDDSARPEVDEKNNGLFHFITYLNINNTIYELDGLKRSPIKHDNLLSPDEFYDKLPEVLHRRISKYSDEIRFSLLAITNDKLQQYQALGDELSTAQELDKRQRWARDNQWRRHDYTRLTVELLKDISSSLPDNEWEEVLRKAKLKTMNKSKV